MGPGGKFPLSPVYKNNNKIVRNMGVGGSFGPISAIQPTNPRGVGGSPRPADSALSKSVVKRSQSMIVNYARFLKAAF